MPTLFVSRQVNFEVLVECEFVKQKYFEPYFFVQKGCHICLLTLFENTFRVHKDTFVISFSCSPLRTPDKFFNFDWLIRKPSEGTMGSCSFTNDNHMWSYSFQFRQISHIHVKKRSTNSKKSIRVNHRCLSLPKRTRLTNARIYK